MRTLGLFALMLISFASSVMASDDFTLQNTVEIEWLDLIPEAERARVSEINVQALNHNLDAAKQIAVGEVRNELNGSKVKIPGFVIPLEGDADSISEFLLVPFYGACIHVPPPPPNQIIYVKFEKGAPTKDLWDIVYVSGTLQTLTLVTEELGVESGYTMLGASLESYDNV